MPKYLGRTRIGFSQRTDRKVRARDLVGDGEIKGLWVAKDEADRFHPLNTPRAISPDRAAIYAIVPEDKREAVTISVGLETSASDLGGGRLSMAPLVVQLGNYTVG